jgi:hypothetical protein
MNLKKLILIGLTVILLLVVAKQVFAFTPREQKINCAHPTTLLENVVCTIYGFIT